MILSFDQWLSFLLSLVHKDHHLIPLFPPLRLDYTYRNLLMNIFSFYWIFHYKIHICAYNGQGWNQNSVSQLPQQIIWPFVWRTQLVEWKLKQCPCPLFLAAQFKAKKRELSWSFLLYPTRRKYLLITLILQARRKELCKPCRLL